MRSNISVLIFFAIPFILLMCFTPGVFGAFMFSGVFSLFMYINLLISARINAKIGGEDGMEKNAFYRFLFMLIFSISVAVLTSV